MHTYTATITPQLHTALLIDYLNPSTTLAEMSRRHSVPLAQLIEWTERDDVVELTEAYARASAKRAALLAVIATPSALRSTLVCLDSPNPETARRAAATILRQAQRPQPAPDPRASRTPERAPRQTPHQAPQPAPNPQPSSPRTCPIQPNRAPSVPAQSQASNASRLSHAQQAPAAPPMKSAA